MEEINIDFHIHSRYSGGTSQDMSIPRIAEEAYKKGLNVVGTGDATHPRWLKHLERNLNGDGIYSTNISKTRFIVSTEVEDRDRVHHLILFPDLESAHSFRDAIRPYSANIDSDGRPHLSLSGEDIAGIANDHGCLIGPCHAFTPWTSLYKSFDSLKQCYGANTKHVTFLELGLSADTDMADRIAELQDLTFMSNSDAHSPWPYRLGREFNRLSVEEVSFDEIRMAVERKSGRRFVLNVGLNPREGKYHETACTRCYLKFRPEDAKKLGRRCPECGGVIKKGVRERISELASWKEPRYPPHRPPYIHIIPLAEVIGMALGIKTLRGRVQIEWEEMVEKFGNEIQVLIDASIDSLIKYDQKIGSIIKAFREDKILYDSGGGGRYGKPLYNRSIKERFYDLSQRSLSDFQS